MTDKLLQVLDMTEEEKAVALYNLGHDVINDRCRVHWNWMADGTGRLKSLDNPQELPYIDKRELAGLAFRRKNEAKDDFVFGLIEVFQYITERSKLEIPSPAEMIKESQPIHWIIASLIAKELAKEKRRPL